MPPVLPWNWALPKLKTPPSAASIQYPPTPPLGWPPMVNQFECRLKAAARALPVTDTVPAEPTTVDPRTRPPKSPNPLREVTTMVLSVPICG